MIEHMLEKERKEKEKEEIIEFRAMDAMYNRGEVDVNDDRQLHRGGEREAFPPWRSSSPSESSLTKKRAKICDEKWSLADAVLLHGTLDQVRRIILTHQAVPTMLNGRTPILRLNVLIVYDGVVLVVRRNLPLRQL